MRQITAAAVKTDARKKFSAYKKETAKIPRIIEVKENPVLGQLKDILEFWELDVRLYYTSDGTKAYEQACELVKNTRCSAGDIERFSIALAESSNEENDSDKRGFFLSALISASEGMDFVIHTIHLPEINYLGFKNEKNIVINGSAGSSVGKYMKEGKIVVKGNSGRLTGQHMESGIITIEGDAGYAVGDYMKGGTIVVKGDTGHNVGYFMEGGEIHTEGACRSISKYVKGGKIYHKGKLVYQSEG